MESTDIYLFFSIVSLVFWLLGITDVLQMGSSAYIFLAVAVVLSVVWSATKIFRAPRIGETVVIV